MIRRAFFATSTLTHRLRRPRALGFGTEFEEFRGLRQRPRQCRRRCVRNRDRRCWHREPRTQAHREQVERRRHGEWVVDVTRCTEPPWFTSRAHGRRRAHDDAHARAERAGVLVSGPLGLCFLPAFVCLGIVPVVIGLAGTTLAGL